MKNTIERKLSVINKYSQLETIHRLPNFPVFMGCVDHLPAEDLFADQDWDICQRTGIIQLKKLIPLDVLYREQHCSVVGKLWQDHHLAFARFINETAPQLVLEIGGAHGTLSKNFLQLQKSASWTILEPNPAPSEGVTARYISGFFDEKFVPDCKYDALVHSHVFEHMYEPEEFVRSLANFGGDEVKHIFSVPDIKNWLRKKYTNALNFEHSVFIVEEYIEYFLKKYGFKVIRKESYGDEHSIFYEVKKIGGSSCEVCPPNLYDRHKSMFLDYIKYHEDLIKSLNTQIQLSSEKIYLFGAHVFSQYLLAFGLDQSKVECIIDNNPLKHNLRLYGTNLMVRSPEILRGLRQPRVIVKAGSHTDEIKNKIMEEVNANTIFIG